jgi:signal transduction histidine kinase/PAS domain-containing protein
MTAAAPSIKSSLERRMETPFTSPDPTHGRASAPGATQNQVPLPDQHSRQRQGDPLRWLHQHSFAPRWLPMSLRHPLVGYLIAVLVQLIAAGVMLPFTLQFPRFSFVGALAFLGIVVLALGWGAGPSLCSTLVGACLLYFAILSPHFIWGLAEPADAFGLVLFVVVGVCISLLASREAKVRRQLAETNQQLIQAEAGSRADAQRLQAVLDVLPSAVAIADKDGRLLEVNPALRALWGESMPLANAPAQYGVYRGWWTQTGRLVTAEDWGLARALSTGEVSVNEEVEIETFAGQHKTILNSAAPLRDETGAITGGVVAEQDISDLRRLEREIAERATVLQTLFETITDGIVLVDQQGWMLQTNYAYRALIGVDQYPEYATLALLDRLSLLDLRNEHGQPLPQEEWPPVRLLQGEALTGVDVSLKNLNEHEVVVNISGAPLRDETGQLSGAVEVFRDVTERRRWERRTHEALNALVAMGQALVQGGGGTSEADAPFSMMARATAQRIAALTHQVVDCQCVTIGLLDPETETLIPLVASNVSPDQEATWATRLCGAPLVERLGDPARVARLQAGEVLLLDRDQLPPPIVRPDRGTATLLVAPMLIGKRLVGVLTVHQAASGHPYAPEDVERVGAVARLAALVIERERLLSEREEARAAVLAEREANRHMDAFLSMVSHELKQPLTVLRGHLQLAHRRVGRLIAPPTALSPLDLADQLAPFAAQLTAMDQQIEHQDRLVNDLLDAARIRTGTFAIHRESVNLLPLVQGAVAEQRLLTREREISLHLPDVEEIPVLADRRRIEQVVTNYLTNALKYSPASCPVEVGVTVADQQARVWVRDQGPGLTPEQQQHIFERFYRVPGIAVQSGTGIGLGLGLTICRIIVEQHGGQLGVESIPGQGSTFWFTLPQAKPTQHATG